MQKLFYLPEPHTDFIYATVCEELSLMGALPLLTGFVILGHRGLRAAYLSTDPFGKPLAEEAARADRDERLQDVETAPSRICLRVDESEHSRSTKPHMEKFVVQDRRGSRSGNADVTQLNAGE